MGVNHLKQHASKARASQINNGPPDAGQIKTPLSTRPAANSAENNAPVFGAVRALSQKALHPKIKAAQPEHGGARAGAKSGKPYMGKKGPAHPMSGGSLR